MFPKQAYSSDSCYYCSWTVLKTKTLCTKVLPNNYRQDFLPGPFALVRALTSQERLRPLSVITLKLIKYTTVNHFRV